MYYNFPASFIPIAMIDTQQIPQGNYSHHLDWHWAWEVWAHQNNIQYPEMEMGFVPHFNIIGANGFQYHVYLNAYNIYEAVPAGGTPGGF